MISFTGHRDTGKKIMAVGAANLTDPANGNFTPLPNSPALRSGTHAMAPTDDFLGNPRPAGAIDRGAIQVSK